ncbi:MAG: class I SAM-dependent methyltransferase [Actinobacteria bacterium]|nr:MAG: class I SAM-dependent methyltransferase [Actinomycetota bacterium]
MATSSAVEQKQRVKTYWEREACGEIHSEAPEGTPEFYAEVEQRRDELEPHIARFADFEGARGLRVLEIGVGLGTDLVRFVRAGANATGVDLTDRAVRLVRRRLELEELEADLRVADAEALPFEDESFDRVYSWGVLHHTPDTARAVREGLRVLRPGGELCVMLYARHSWVASGFWVRHALLAGRPWRSLSDVLARHMESEGTKAYAAGELRRMFAGLDELRIDKVATAYDRQLAGPLARLTGNRLGWQFVIRGRKPS